MIVELIIFGVTYISMLVGLWIKINLKIKELEIKITNIEFKQDKYESQTLNKLESIESKLETKINHILEKQDVMYEKLTILQTEHNISQCNFIRYMEQNERK